jgi:hypothetical protein
MLDRRGPDLKRPMEMGVRVPATLEGARQVGLDLEEWHRRGLIDFDRRSEPLRQ